MDPKGIHFQKEEVQHFRSQKVMSQKTNNRFSQKETHFTGSIFHKNTSLHIKYFLYKIT